MPILDDWVTVEAPLAPNVPIIDPHVRAARAHRPAMAI